MYSYGIPGLSTLAMAGGTALTLLFLGFIAAIVVTVVFYQKFISEGKVAKIPGMKHDWGPYFRFETLIIEKILQVLYIFTACLIAFESAALILSSLFTLAYAPLETLIGIIIIAIVCVVLEVLNRLGFETTMLNILIWKNTAVIRKTVTGDSSGQPVMVGDGPAPRPSEPAPSARPVTPTPSVQHASAASSPTPHYQAVQPTPSEASQPTEPVSRPAAPAPQAPATQPTAPSTPAQPESHEWTCPSCGSHNKIGSFCGQCGTRRP